MGNSLGILAVEGLIIFQKMPYGSTIIVLLLNEVKTMLDQLHITFQTTIPKETYTILKSRGRYKERLASDARQTLAMLYFQDRTLSLGQAADMAGLDRWDFIEFLSKHNIPVIDLDEEEFEDEVLAVAELVNQIKRD